jgi:hypothetical protein
MKRTLIITALVSIVLLCCLGSYVNCAERVDQKQGVECRIEKQILVASEYGREICRDECDNRLRICQNDCDRNSRREFSSAYCKKTCQESYDNCMDRCDRR